MCYRNKLVFKKNRSGLTISGLTIAYSFISLFYLLMTLLFYVAVFQELLMTAVIFTLISEYMFLFVVFIVCIGSVQARMKMFGKY